MTEAEATTLRTFLDWLANSSPDFYLCESGPGYEYPDFVPLRDEDGGVARLMAAYVKHQNTPPEPSAIPFANSMMRRAFAAAEKRT